MYKKTNDKLFPLLTAGLGAAALVVRLALFLLGRDEKGLLIPGHPLDILSWIITDLAAVLAVIAALKLYGSRKYKNNFGPSTTAAVGCFALAGGIAAAVISGWNLLSRLDLIRSICGLLAIPALFLLGLHRKKGRRPVFLLHGMVCLYLILFAVSHYQLWSSRPQIHDWFFAMAGSLLLTLFAYQQTAFDVSMGSRRMQLATGLLAAYFCLAAMAGGDDIQLYLGGAVWALTNLCRLTPVPRRRPNPITENTPEETE